MQALLSLLQGAADPTRLRLLFLVAEGELTVTELTAIVGQSQPRVSRHLKLLCEAGLLERFKEGSWVFPRLRDTGQSAAFAKALMSLPLLTIVLILGMGYVTKYSGMDAVLGLAFFSYSSQSAQAILYYILTYGLTTIGALQKCGQSPRHISASAFSHLPLSNK